MDRVAKVLDRDVKMSDGGLFLFEKSGSGFSETLME